MIVKKYFFISNRQSGKTTMALYEYLKDPENTVLVCTDGSTRDSAVKRSGIEPSKCKNVISADRLSIRGKKIKRLIFDEYLFIDYEKRLKLHASLMPLGIEEIICFSTPERLYDKNVFEFVVELKKEKRTLAFDVKFNKKFCFSDVLIEITDPMIKTSDKIREEMFELYHNYLTDPDTVLIHNANFFNKKIYNLENVSYFPDISKELTELKGQFINDTDTKGFTDL